MITLFQARNAYGRFKRRGYDPLIKEATRVLERGHPSDYLKAICEQIDLPSRVVVDMGCGSGRLRKLLKRAQYIGVDSIVYSKLPVFHRGKLDCAPTLPNHFADFVVFARSIFADGTPLRPKIQEAKRLLKPSGRILIYEGNYPHSFWTTTKNAAIRRACTFQCSTGKGYIFK